MEKNVKNQGPDLITPDPQIRVALTKNVENFVRNQIVPPPAESLNIWVDFPGPLLELTPIEIKVPRQFGRIRESFQKVAVNWNKKLKIAESSSGSGESEEVDKVSEDSSEESSEEELPKRSQRKKIVPVVKKIEAKNNTIMKTRKKVVPQVQKKVTKSNRKESSSESSAHSSDEDSQENSEENSSDEEGSEDDGRKRKGRWNWKNNKIKENHPWYRESKIVRDRKDFEEITELPVYKNRTLRDYQMDGVNWLVSNWFAGRSCILADEMGVGKTMQCLAFLDDLKKKRKLNGPFLVVAPLTTLGHWEGETRDYFDLTFIKVHGEEREDRMNTAIATKPNVILTSYEVLRDEKAFFTKIFFQVAIFDESHRVKNEDAIVSQIAANLNTDFKLLITGTPVQNNLSELHNMLKIIDEKRFQGSREFEMLQEGNYEAFDKIKSMIDPYILRRTKKDIDLKLPPKKEIIIDVELTNQQKTMYRAVYDKNVYFLKYKFQRSMATQMFNSLKHICNHPYLLEKGVEDPIVTEMTKENPKLTPLDCMIRSSAKLVLVDKIVRKVKQDGQKLLIFSQSLPMLDILDDYLEESKYSYVRLDGGCSELERMESMSKFNSDPECFVFLLSTKAGGIGINLIAANNVIIYDSDPNPFNDSQAAARVHRIGQTKPVHVYRLVTRNTYEHVILQRAGKRLAFGTLLLEKSSKPTDESMEELQNLLKKGAYHILQEDLESSKKKDTDLLNTDLDEILAKSSEVVTEENTSASQLEGAYFAAPEDKDTRIELDDKDFWTKMIPEGFNDIDSLTVAFNKEKFDTDEKKQKYMKQIHEFFVYFGKLQNDSFRHDTQQKFWTLMYKLKGDSRFAEFRTDFEPILAQLEFSSRKGVKKTTHRGEKILESSSGSSSEEDVVAKVVPEKKPKVSKKKPEPPPPTLDQFGIPIPTSEIEQKFSVGDPAKKMKSFLHVRRAREVEDPWYRKHQDLISGKYIHPSNLVNTIVNGTFGPKQVTSPGLVYNPIPISLMSPLNVPSPSNSLMEFLSERGPSMVFHTPPVPQVVQQPVPSLTSQYSPQSTLGKQTQLSFVNSIVTMPFGSDMIKYSDNSYSLEKWTYLTKDFMACDSQGRKTFFLQNATFRGAIERWFSGANDSNRATFLTAVPELRQFMERPPMQVSSMSTVVAPMEYSKYSVPSSAPEVSVVIQPTPSRIQIPRTRITEFEMNSISEDYIQVLKAKMSGEKK